MAQLQNKSITVPILDLHLKHNWETLGKVLWIQTGVIHSPKGLLGTSVQFLINAIVYSTNYMAVASMHLGVWSWSRQSPELQTECQNGEER